MPRTPGSRQWRAVEGEQREVINRDGVPEQQTRIRARRKRDDLLMMPYARVNMPAFMTATRHLSPVGHDIIALMMARTDRNTYRVTGITMTSIAHALGVGLDTVKVQVDMLRQSELLTYSAKGRRWSWDARVVQHGVIDMDDLDGDDVPFPAAAPRLSA